MATAPSHAASAAAAPLELDGVARSFGARWVLRGASLRIDAGAVVALMGRNGSGKTTLLRVAATLLRPGRGSARVFGHDTVRDPESARSRVGLLGHAPALYEDLTAAENLRFARAMHAERRSADAERALLRAVGLERDADTRVRTFSAGMRRRLALARLLVRPPGLLLLDEPFASLDEEGVELVLRVIEDTRARGGAVLLTTHEATRAADLAARVVVLENGKLS